MNDPWDVKSVRKSDQYESCIKINGVPLLPPVLSKECRKEMQYYKLLAKEVEKRISILKPYVDDDSDSEDRTDAPELLEHEQNYDIVEAVSAVPPDNIQKMDAVMTDVYNSITSNVTLKRTETTCNDTHNYVIDLNVSINETSRNVTDQVHSPTPTPIEVPERDYDYKNKPEKEILTDIEKTHSGRKDIRNEFMQEIMNLNFSLDNDVSDPILDVPSNQDGPPSLTSKSFTGSLRDIHTESAKEVTNAPKLLRQRSYTLLNPSPQLLAHLEVQSLNTGMDVSTISMSDSLSNICLKSKKRRSWDLETAKIKWSSMALELKKTNVVSKDENVKLAKTNNNNGASNGASNGVNTSHVARAVVKKSPPVSPSVRSQSVVSDKNRRGSINSKTLKEQPKPKNYSSPTKVTTSEKPVREPISPTNKTSVKEPQTKANRALQKKQTLPNQNAVVDQTSPKQTPGLISSAEDPAAAVNELYEKIQKQQLLQMASLVEKQKREQMLLQQVFEEQNHILFNQLKSICPQSSLEIKRAWGDKEDTDRGPVSLSQLISHNTPEKRPESPASTLTETNSYINHCDDVLKKSRDITNSIKKQQAKPKSGNGKVHPEADGSRTRTHSPTGRNYSRKLTYDSASEQYDPILTDRTNDTMADLNVTFPSDTEEGRSYYSSPTVNQGMEVAVKRRSPVRGKAVRATDSAIRNLEDSIQTSMNTMCGRATKSSAFHRPPTAQERAAATKIVAFARGYLVRRLMRTERVQATVQTIRDALLCALQLHTERDGIRGADVDLHRRLIQQITAACYSLHDTFVASSPSERCAVIAADRARRRAQSGRQATPRSIRQSGDVMTQSHSGAFPARIRRPSTTLMTQSSYETFSSNKCCSASRSRYLPAPRRRPWR